MHSYFTEVKPKVLPDFQVSANPQCFKLQSEQTEETLVLDYCTPKICYFIQKPLSHTPIFFHHHIKTLGGWERWDKTLGKGRWSLQPQFNWVHCALTSSCKLWVNATLVKSVNGSVFRWAILKLWNTISAYSHTWCKQIQIAQDIPFEAHAKYICGSKLDIACLSIWKRKNYHISPEMLLFPLLKKRFEAREKITRSALYTNMGMTDILRYIYHIQEHSYSSRK